MNQQLMVLMFMPADGQDLHLFLYCSTSNIIKGQRSLQVQVQLRRYLGSSQISLPLTYAY